MKIGKKKPTVKHVTENISKDQYIQGVIYGQILFGGQNLMLDENIKYLETKQNTFDLHCANSDSFVHPHHFFNYTLSILQVGLT